MGVISRRLVRGDYIQDPATGLFEGSRPGGGSGDHGGHGGGHTSSSKPFTDHERTALDHWTGQDYQKINGHLRRGDAIDDAGAKDIAGLDDALAHSTTAKELTAYRGLAAPAWGSLEPGDTFADKGFVSTSLSQSRSHTVTIDIPKGYHAIHIANEFPMMNAAEDEVLLPRGSRFRVTAKQPNDLHLRALP